MTSFNRIRQNYVRQLNQNDCGRACIAMLLLYNDTEQKINDLIAVKLPDAGLSLFQMQELTIQLGFDTQCVEMEIDDLDRLSSPCILHTINYHGDPHYVVCFGTRKIGKESFYIIGDPGSDVLLYTRNELNDLWQSKAALYFIFNRKRMPKGHSYGWIYFFQRLTFAKGIWIVVPAISAFALLTGAGIAWLLQQTSRTLAPAAPLLITIHVALLAMLFLSRTLLTFIRQQLLVRLTRSTGEFFIKKVLRDFFVFQRAQQRMSEAQFKLRLQDIQKVQQANLAISSVLFPDALVCLLIVGLTGYILPATLCCSLALMTLQGYMATKRLAFQNIELNSLTCNVRDFETASYLAYNTIDPAQNVAHKETVYAGRIEHYGTLLAKAERIGYKTNRIGMSLDLVNLFYLGIVYLLAHWSLNSGAVSTTEMIVITASGFLMTTITSRIFTVLPQIDAGVVACYRLQYNY
jgi:ABC-type bacteriocin/lantibiotic exporter with double-glycine peptidase domain